MGLATSAAGATTPTRAGEGHAAFDATCVSAEWAMPSIHQENPSMKTTTCCSALAGLVLLAAPMLARATVPQNPPQEFIACGVYLVRATVQFSEDAYTAGVMTKAEVFKLGTAPLAGDPRWASVYSESASRPGPTSPWATNTQQHTAYNAFPEPAITWQVATKQLDMKVPTCEIKGRAVFSIGCPGRETFSKDVEVTWPGCGS